MTSSKKPRGSEIKFKKRPRYTYKVKNMGKTWGKTWGKTSSISYKEKEEKKEEEENEEEEEEKKREEAVQYRSDT